MIIIIIIMVIIITIIFSTESYSVLASTRE